MRGPGRARRSVGIEERSGEQGQGELEQGKQREPRPATQPFGYVGIWVLGNECVLDGSKHTMRWL